MFAPTYGLSELTDRIPCSERLEKVGDRPVEQATRVVTNVTTRTRESVLRKWGHTGELRIRRPKKGLSASVRRRGTRNAIVGEADKDKPLSLLCSYTVVRSDGSSRGNST
ncbi:MAG: hypothetical protein RL326_1807 [Pseudomonadota bacterium]|jgi:hypothetical protein